MMGSITISYSSVVSCRQRGSSFRATILLSICKRISLEIGDTPEKHICLNHYMENNILFRYNSLKVEKSEMFKIILLFLLLF